MNKPVPESPAQPATLEQRVKRIEEVLGTFIAWSARELGSDNAKALLNELHGKNEASREPK
jgi:hypothetical protein